MLRDEGVELYKVLKAEGTPVKLTEFPNTTHMFYQLGRTLFPEQYKQGVNEIVEFIKDK